MSQNITWKKQVWAADDDSRLQMDYSEGTFCRRYRISPTDNDILPQNESVNTESAGLTAQTQGQVANSVIYKVVSAVQYY